MPGKTKNYSPEFREEAARLVVETSRAIADVARELGISETSLGNWVRAYREKHAEDEPPLRVSERARLRELERQLQVRRAEIETLGGDQIAALIQDVHRAEAALDLLKRRRQRLSVKRNRCAGMARKHEQFTPQHENAAERAIKKHCALAGLFGAGMEIGSSHAAQKERVACEKRLAVQQIAR